MAEAQHLGAMGELLDFHRIVSSADEVTTDNLEDVVTEFQLARSLLADGIAGPETLWELQRPWVEREQRLMLVRCEADIPPNNGDGYPSLVLREDAAARFNALAAEVRSFGGVVTTAGGLRELSFGANAHRSAKSMHYPAIAFDLALPSGFFDPKNDPYVIVADGDNYWRVWARAEGGDEVELKATYWDHWNAGKDRTKTVRGRFVDFTEICRKHGFHRIRSRDTRRKRSRARTGMCGKTGRPCAAAPGSDQARFGGADRAEDLLEFMHALQSENRRPARLHNELTSNGLLLLGCSFSGWLAWFFIRIAKRDGESWSRGKLDILAGTDAHADEGLALFRGSR